MYTIIFSSPKYSHPERIIHYYKICILKIIHVPDCPYRIDTCPFKPQRKMKKNPKLQLCRQHVPLEALFLAVGGLILHSKEIAVFTVQFWIFSSCHQRLKWSRPICQVVTSHKERLIHWKFVSIINHHRYQ